MLSISTLLTPYLNHTLAEPNNSNEVKNRKSAYGLTRAANASIPTTYHNLLSYKKRYPESSIQLAREEYDAELASIILSDTPHPDLIVCAGWMHILTPSFLTTVTAAGIPVINLHPALPGEFAGAGAIERAWEAGKKGDVTRTGVMIHEVIAEVDAGRAIAVQEVELRQGESLEELEDRIHQVEHRLIVEGTKKKLQEIGDKRAKEVGGSQPST